MEKAWHRGGDWGFWTAFLPLNESIPFFLWHRYSGVPVIRKEKRRWGAGNRAWDRWLKDNFVMGVLYMTIYTAVQVGLHGTLSSSWTTERGPGERWQRGMSPEETFVTCGQRMVGFVGEC